MNELSANKQRTSWTERGFFLALLVICLLPLSKNQPDPDFWGHVQYGSDVLREGLPASATYSYNAVGHRWVNHETLSELALASGIQTLGPVGLLCAKLLLAAMLLGYIIHRSWRAGASQTTIVVVALFTSINLMHFWLLRPQLSSYLFFASLVILLTWSLPSGLLLTRETADAKHSARRLTALWLVVPMFAIWANSHGGFVAGYALLVTFLTARGIQLFIEHRRRAWPTLFHFVAIVAAAGLATAMNPAGFELHAWLWQSLGTPRPEIVEWRAPELTSIAWLPWWLLVAVSVVAVACSRKARDPAQMALLALVLWQAVEHRRHIPFFTILFACWLVPHIDDLLRRGQRKIVPTEAPTPSRLGKLFLAATAAITLIAGMTLYRQVTTMPVLRCRYPVSAFQFMENEQLHGKLVVRFMWAQYAISAFGSTDDVDRAIQVAFDGRFRTCYPQSIVDMYFDFAVGDRADQRRFRSSTSGPIDDSRILNYRSPDLVLVDRHQENPVDVLTRNASDWTLLYQDELTQLFGRRAKYDDPTHVDYLPPARRSITESTQTGYVSWPALPTRQPLTTLATR